MGDGGGGATRSAPRRTPTARSASCCGSTPPGRPSRRSPRSGCATRGASPSTARPRTSGSPTSARTTFEEIDALPAGRIESRPAAELRLVGVRGHRSLQPRPERAQRHRAGARVRTRPRLLDHRRLRRPRPRADLALRPLHLRRLLRGELRSFTADPKPEATDDRPLGVDVSQISLVRRGPPGQDLRGLARGPGLPARPGRLTTRAAARRYPERDGRAGRAGAPNRVRGRERGACSRRSLGLPPASRRPPRAAGG